MKRWFSRQPIHRKLVLTSLAKTTVVLGITLLVLLAVDAWRFRTAAQRDADSTARLVAENIRAMLDFDQFGALSANLDLLRTRPQILRTCVYDEDGELVGHYVRGDAGPCSERFPEGGGSGVLSAIQPVESRGTRIGWVLIERDWAWLQQNIVTAALTSLVVLVLASVLMVVVSHRLHRRISQPITQLAAAARRIGEDESFTLPPITAPADEVGDLVRAFGAMTDRVRDAREELTSTNETLRREIAERRLVEAERERLFERERQANRVKDEFLATVSHELRTPLNAIVGWARILSMSPPDPKTIARAADSLHRNAQLQARVIDDLIDISRIVTGKLKVVTAPLDLRQVIDSAVDVIRPTAEQSGVRLTVQVPAGPSMLQGDRDRLQQVVWNLLSNAVKFAPGGRVDVTLGQEDDALVLSVADDGVGIAPEFIDHVFDRFRQADATITRQHGGLGIGLAVAKELVELHGGRIRAESGGRGAGAAFVVRLPRCQDHSPSAATDDGLPSLAGVSVLTVDDNPDSLEVVQVALSAAGADVRGATSGREALALWQEAPADVLLCDLAMPGMSGFEVLAEIRRLDGAHGRVTPAIAVTAHATDDHVMRSVQAGFQAHVAKPVDPGRLIREVAAVRTQV